MTGKELIISLIIIVGFVITLWVLLSRESKRHRENLFCCRADKNVHVKFLRFVDGIDADFKTNTYVIFWRFDMQQEFVTLQEDFEKNFQKL